LGLNQTPDVMGRWDQQLFYLRNAIAGSWLRWIALALGALLVAAAAWAATAASNFVLEKFGGTVSSMGDRRLEHPVQRAGELSGALFAELVANHWLEFNRSTARLDLLADCDALALGFPAYDLRPGRGPKEDIDAARTVTRKVCRSDPGTTIREEVGLWNQRTSVVAVRDDRDGNRPCDNGLTQDVFTPEGCHSAVWQAGFALTAVDTATAATLTGGLPAEVGVFLTANVHAGFGGWNRFDGSTARDGAMVLRSTVTSEGSSGRRTVTVDVIGDVVSADWQETAQVARDPLATRAPPASIELLCDKPTISRQSCKRILASARGRHVARGSRITFQFEGARAVELRVVVKPAPAIERRIVTLERARFRTPDPGEAVGDDPDRTIRLTDQVVARCNQVDPAVIAYDIDDETELRIPASLGNAETGEVNVCMLDWVTRKPAPVNVRTASSGASAKATPTAAAPAAAAAEPGLLTVRLGGVEPLALTKAVSVPDPAAPGKTRTVIAPTDETKALALLPLVGADEGDAGSLIGQLRPRVPPGGNRDLELTIDARLQRISFDHLKGLMTRRPAFAEINAMMPPQYNAERRGAIVLIDAGAKSPGGYDDDAGRILAAATWPQVEPGLSESDLRAMEKMRPSRSPLAARGWAQNDRFNAPGSSIKPIVALAAIDRAARGDDTIADMLGAEPGRPGLDAAGIQRTLGNQYNFSFTTDELVVPFYAGSRRERPHSITTYAGGEGTLCTDVPGKCKGNGRVRLHDMLIHSDNIWFARLALALDDNVVSTVGPNGKRVEIKPPARTDASPAGEPLAIARIVSRLWPDQAGNILPSDTVRRFSRLQASPIQLDETRADGPRLLSVALNGIGQSAQATPLAMASIMASIATGRIVLPRLTPQDDARRTARGQPLLDPGTVDGRRLDAGRAEQMIDSLRRALAGVVRSGTAAAAFKNSDLVERLHAKTGTAQSDDKDGPDTVWFVGWLDGLAMPGLEGRRIGFACMLTHANPDDAAGGKSCAPLMRMLFERIEPPRSAPAAKAAR
jgi:cell division protein FtsI/penicillin-binding protein 2